MRAPVKITDHTLEVPTFIGDVADTQVVRETVDNTITIESPLSVMTKEQALVHAAWIVVSADRSENFQKFRQILKAVL